MSKLPDRSTWHKYPTNIPWKITWKNYLTKVPTKYSATSGTFGCACSTCVYATRAAWADVRTTSRSEWNLSCLFSWILSFRLILAICWYDTVFSRALTFCCRKTAEGKWMPSSSSCSLSLAASGSSPATAEAAFEAPEDVAAVWAGGAGAGAVWVELSFYNWE